MKAVIGVLVVGILLYSQASNLGYFSAYDVRNVITCSRQVYSRGRTIFIPSPPQKLNIRPGRPGTVWRPAYGGRNLTTTEINLIDFGLLHAHLGDDFDSSLSSVLQPDPTNIPTLGSSLQRMFPVTVPAELLASDNNTVSAIVMQWTQMRLGCQLSAQWTDLGPNFFPRWYAGRLCSSTISGSTCGIPRQSCYPNLTASYEYVTVLNMDCCLTYDPNLAYPYVRRCGWIKVQVPLPTACFCGC